MAQQRARQAQLLSYPVTASTLFPLFLYAFAFECKHPVLRLTLPFVHFFFFVVLSIGAPAASLASYTHIILLSRHLASQMKAEDTILLYIPYPLPLALFSCRAVWATGITNERPFFLFSFLHGFIRLGFS